MVTPPEGYRITEAVHPDEVEIFREYGRHLVCLAFLARRRQLTGKPEEQIKCFFCSGFVMEYEGRWYWTTAGHILEDIEKLRKDPDNIVEGFHLLDAFGSGAIDKNPVPFAFECAWQHFEYNRQSGLDYGAVELDWLIQQGLQKNNVQPIPMTASEDVDGGAFTDYIIFGLPEDSVERRIAPNPVGFTVSGKPTPCMISVEKVDGDPGEIHRTTFPRFVGRLSKRWPEGEVDGMSGGPVFGIKEHTMESQVIAVQSHWFRPTRVTFACPLAVFVPRLSKAIRDRGEPK